MSDANIQSLLSLLSEQPLKNNNSFRLNALIENAYQHFFDVNNEDACIDKDKLYNDLSQLTQFMSDENIDTTVLFIKQRKDYKVKIHIRHKMDSYIVSYTPNKDIVLLTEYRFEDQGHAFLIELSIKELASFIRKKIT